MGPICFVKNNISDYFSNPSNKKEDWQYFYSSEEDLAKPVSQLVPDMVIHGDPSEKSWQKTALRIASWAISIVIFPLGVYQLTRYTVQRVAMTFIYPAQSHIVSVFSKSFSNAVLDEERKKAFTKAQREWEFKVIRRIVIEVEGVKYDGMMLANHPENGKWVLQATGNGEPIEQAIDTCASIYSKQSIKQQIETVENDLNEIKQRKKREGLDEKSKEDLNKAEEECQELLRKMKGAQKQEMNVLMINNPGVGRSEGQATPESMGKAQRAGLIFLESALRARNIVIAGHSLGGMAISQAILKHSFKEKIQYSAAFMLTFARIESLAAKTVGLPIVESLVKWAGIHSDAPAACKEMAENGSRVYIYQASKDKGLCGECTIKKPEEFDHFVTDGPFKSDDDIQSGQGPILKEEGLSYVLGNEVSKEQPLSSFIQLIGMGRMEHNNGFLHSIVNMVGKEDPWKENGL